MERQDHLAETPPAERPPPWPSRGCEIHDAAFVTAKIHLMETRGMADATATKVLQTHKCEECECVIHGQHDGDCECPCHCQCCCAPLFRCVVNCACECECHYEPQTEGSDRDEEFEDDKDDTADIVCETPQSPTSADETSQNEQTKDATDIKEHHDNNKNLNGSQGSESEQDGQDANEEMNEETRTGEMSDIDDEEEESLTNTKVRLDDTSDEAMDHSLTTDEQEESPTDGDQPTKNGQQQKQRPNPPTEIFKTMAEQMATQATTSEEEQHDSDKEKAGAALAANFFKLAYNSVVQSSTTKKVDNHLPKLTHDEHDLLTEYMSILVINQKASFQRAWAAMRDVSVASTRSTWSFTKILQDRTSAAKIPKSEPANIWAMRNREDTKGIEKTQQEIYRFDAEIYDAKTIIKLRQVCEQQHGFAEGTRTPTTDEWTIMLGIMDGNILARAHPQFLKRCCTMRQFAWFHRQLILRAEGELWAQLPVTTKIYNVNQSSRRLIAAISQSAEHQKWTDARLKELLGAVKVASYDKARHSIHLHFYTKATATVWEGSKIPFRAASLTLRNPDAKAESKNADEGQSGSGPIDDGLPTDRYQSFYKMRLSNVPHTMDMDKFTKFLQQLTDDEMQIGVPLDSYGPQSESSLLWDFYAKHVSCPTALKDIHRIVWP